MQQSVIRQHSPHCTHLHFTISEVYEQCPEVSRTVVYEIVTEHLQYRKIARRPFGTGRE